MTLATKYRPLTFNDVIGQDIVVSILKGAIAKKAGRIFLLSGTRGSGKTTLARIIANEYNGTSNSEVDALEIDGASLGKVDSIENIILPYIRSYPLLNSHKLITIDECHMLSKQAWAMLLKETEELPKHVVMVFATTDYQKVPQAIVSRTLNLHLRNINDSAIYSRLQYIANKEQIQITESALRIISKEANGSMREAISIMEAASMLNQEITDSIIWQILGDVNIEIMNQFLKALSENKNIQVSEILNQVKDKLYFYTQLMKYISELIVAIYTGKAEALWQKTDLNFLQHLLKKMVNMNVRLLGSETEITILIDAFFIAMLTWIDQTAIKEPTVTFDQLAKTAGLTKVW